MQKNPEKYTFFITEVTYFGLHHTEINDIPVFVKLLLSSKIWLDGVRDLTKDGSKTKEQDSKQT